MLSRFHNRVGTAGLVVAVVALVAAVAGTALAAGGLTKQQEKQVKKIAKKYAGKPGAPGVQGPAGQAGAKGDNGAPGANGTSVTNTAVPLANAKCEERGGAEFKVGTGTPTFACNGKTGFTKTLPSGETETGAWSVGIGTETSFATTSLSFNVPLAAAPTAVHYNESETTECPGTVEEPEAAAGNVCIYAFNSENITFKTISGFPYKWKNGVNLLFEQAAGAFAWGTWAVTAP